MPPHVYSVTLLTYSTAMSPEKCRERKRKAGKKATDNPNQKQSAEIENAQTGNGTEEKLKKTYGSAARNY